MCKRFTTLAQSSDYRHVMQCEHGTIHLTWDLVTLYLSPEEFAQLVELLEEGIWLTMPTSIRKKCCQLVYKESGIYQLWLRNVALNLTTINFLILLDLVRLALKVGRDVSAGVPAEQVRQLSQQFYYMVEASANESFSLN